MITILRIAIDEWRYWLRSRLVLSGMLVFFLLVVTTSILNSQRITAENNSRAQQQSQARATFLEQPDRHPHRMVHYGHYVFRTPAPLAVFDPGLDAVTGQAIFLEGHRQNSAMFAQSSASANLGDFSRLTPALIYQIFAPLIIILLAHGAINREREAGVLSSLLALGISGTTLIAGKLFALFAFIIVMLTPLMLTGLFAVFTGDTIAAVSLLFFSYLIYLLYWGGVTLAVSSAMRQRGPALVGLVATWLMVALVLPSIAVNVANHSVPVTSKIASDLAMLAEVRKLGDGHNASDPAFLKLKADALAKYNVESVDQLPINFRGLVAIESEKKLTDVLNEYAAERMREETRWENSLAILGWLSPTLAVSLASRSIAGTDLAHYHRFQREAEAVRYDFVQALNHAHVHKLSYQDDINRYKDEESGQRARVDATNWQVLDEYQFHIADFSERTSAALSYLIILFGWLCAMATLFFWCGRSMAL